MKTSVKTKKVSAIMTTISSIEEIQGLSDQPLAANMSLSIWNLQIRISYGPRYNPNMSRN